MVLSEREKFIVHRSVLSLLAVLRVMKKEDTDDALEKMVNYRCHNLTDEEKKNISEEMSEEFLMSIGVYKDLGQI